MKFDYHVNITGMRPELLCGLMAAERVFFEFGEDIKVRLAGKNYVVFDKPRDEIICDHLTNDIKRRLTKNFNVSCDPYHIRIDWQEETND